MARTHLSHALLALAASDSARALAERCQISPSTLSKLISSDRRIDVDTLHKLCSIETDSRGGLELLLAHLRDEVDRGGRLQTEVSITADDSTHDDDIRLLAAESPSDPELRAVLHDLAQLIRSARAREKTYQQVSLELVVAETPPAENPTETARKAVQAAEEKRVRDLLEEEQRKKDQVGRSTPRARKRADPK